MRSLLITVAALAMVACMPKPSRVPPITVVYREPLAALELPKPPEPLAARPDTTAAALDMALAQLCRSYAYIIAADPLLRLSAGLEARPALVYPECAKD